MQSVQAISLVPEGLIFLIELAARRLCLFQTRRAAAQRVPEPVIQAQL